MSTPPRPRPEPRVPAWRPAEPPLDTSQPPYTQGSLALSYALPSGISAEPRTSALTLVRPSATGASASDPTGTAPAGAPDAAAWAARFVQAVIEVVSSDRPLSQLVRWTDESVYAEIARRQRTVQLRRGTDPHVRVSRQQVATVHVTQPTSEAAEVTARIVCRGRSRAVAARLEYVRQRWTCTAISFG